MEYKFNKKQHIHTIDDKPLCGTSTVVGVIAKPLTWWASGLAVSKLGWLDPKKNTPEARRIAVEARLAQIMEMSPEDYQNLLDEAYKAHSTKLKDSATAGTDLHEVLEHFVKTKEVKDEKIIPFVIWANENVKRWLWSEAHCYSKELWVGGISDVGAELNDGSYVIIDFKSSKDAYQSQFIQCAGYDLQISENGWLDSNGEVLGKLDKPISQYIIVPFGAEKIEPKIRFNVEELKKGFVSAVILYKLNEQ